MLDSPIEETGEAGSGETEIFSPERLHAISEIDISTSRFWLPTAGGTSEIVEDEAPEVTPPAYRDDSNDVYVAVGRKDSSLDALRWALTEIVIPGTSVFLVHIFPPVTVIPTPYTLRISRTYSMSPVVRRSSVGKMSRYQVAPAQVEAFMREEENKREALFRRYINLCNEYEVSAETMLVESDMVAQTIVKLLETGIIKRLVMGTRRSRLRRKGNGKAEYVHKNAPKDCKIKIICDGKEVVANADQTPISAVTPSPPPTTTTSKDGDDEDEPQEEKSKKQSELCKCFPSLI